MKDAVGGTHTSNALWSAFENLEPRQLLSVMISEIMHHPTPYNPGAEYVELYNSGPAAVDVTGWQFTNGVEFVFPAASIPAGGYLVVAADAAAFQAKYPAVQNVVGGWTGQLSNSRNRLVLEDASGSEVDEVEYADSGDWATRERGRGVSLISTLTNSGTTATASLPGHGFSAGDQVEIFGASPAAYNGTFTLSSVTTNTFNFTLPSNPGAAATGQFLWVRQLTDRTHYGWSWTQFADGLGSSLELINPALTNNQGQNWASSTAAHGTPGQPNSVAAANIAPIIREVMHSPVIPHSTDVVTITARLTDELSTGLSVQLHWRLDGQADFTAATMFDDGLHGDGAVGDGVFGARIPAQADKTIVEYYVQAADGTGLARTWPAAARMPGGAFQQAANALYQVDNTVYSGAQNIYRIIMKNAERLELADIGDGSGDGVSEEDTNAQMNATFISIDGIGTEVRYASGARNRGHGSRSGPPNNYRVNFASDAEWKGLTAINFNSRYTHSQVLGSAILQLAGMQAADAAAVQLRVNGTDLSAGVSSMYGSYVLLENPDGDFAENHIPNDSGGNMYAAFRTDTGVYEEAELTYEGPTADPYRNTYFKLTNAEPDDFSDLIHMFDALTNTPDSLFMAEVSKVINIEQWVRYIAMDSLLNNWETGLNSGYGDDFYMYRGVTDPRFILVPHDLDTILGQGNATGPVDLTIFAAADGISAGGRTTDGVMGLKRLLHHPQVTPLFYQAFVDLIENVFNPQFLNPVIDRTLGGWASATRIADMKAYVVNRSAAVLAQIPRQFTISHSLPVTNGYPTSSTPNVGLSGTADAARTGSVLVNGQLANYDPLTGQWTLSTSGGGSEPETQTLTILPRGSTWRYLDNGSNQGTAWRNLAFDDAAWKSGPARLGYGGDGEVTTVGYIDTDSATAGTQRNATTYFRAILDLPAGQAGTFTALNLDLLRDDGAVVYVNGVEVVRSNISAGTVSYTTWASGTVGNADEDRFYTYTIDPVLLRDGQNIIAVEVHQINNTSTDVGFDLELRATAQVVPTATLVAKGSTWRYLDDGSDQGAYWRGETFDDSAWESGPAQLGFGGNGERTLVGFVDTDPVTAGDQINATTYFRQAFTLTAAQLATFTGLSLNLLRDDGAVVYINGAEAVRSNMDAGLVSYTTWSSTTVGGAAETTFYSYTIDKSLLHEGQNVIAVEVHQCNADSSDLGFDLELHALLKATTVAKVVPQGSTWSYLDNGSNQGTAWRDPDFVDTAWKSGPAQLGFGDGGEATVVGSIDTDPVTAGTQRNATTYFRRAFELAPGEAATFSALTLDLLRDDGAVVYINGVEAARSNMSAGTVSYDTWSSANIGGADESRFYRFDLATSLLHDGRNVIAVEVHQSNNASTDLSFDLELRATVPGSGGGGGGGGTGGVSLSPGVNRLVVQVFDGPNGGGNLIQGGELDVYYPGPASGDETGLPVPEPEVTTLRMLAPASYRPGIPILVQLSALDSGGAIQHDLWDATATLSVNRPDVVLSTTSIDLHNGLGSALVYVTGTWTGDFQITATLGDDSAAHALASLGTVPMTAVSGTLAGTATTWSGIIHVTGDITIPAGHVLTIQPGTLVLLDGVATGDTGIDIDVLGSIQSLGTADAPVTFTAFDPTRPWGELHHSNAAASLYQYTFIHRAGSSPAGGHSNTGPAIRTSGSSITLDHVTITDNRGKIMQGSSSTLVFRDSEMSRSIMGPEVQATAMLSERTWMYEMRNVDDADAIYVHEQGANQDVILRGGMMGFTDDDVLDTLGSDVVVEDYIIRDAGDKGVSAFDGTTTIRRSLVVDNARKPEDGAAASISAKSYGNSSVHVVLDHVTVIGPGAGIQAKDKDGNAPDAVYYTVTNSIIWSPDPVQIDPSHPIDIVVFDITHSLLNETYAGTGNINANPLFVSPAGHNYRLSPGSPAANAADPASPLDPDGSRGDMGRYGNGAPGVVPPATIPAGTLTGDVYLYPAMGPYHVTGDIVIPAGSTLHILPGTTVQFDVGAGITSQGGRLVAEGTAAAPIRITRTPGAGGNWDGLAFAGSMADNVIRHAVLEYGGTATSLAMVSLTDSNLTVESTLFDHTDCYRIRTIASSLVVRDSRFADTFGAGVAPTTDNRSEHINGGGIPAGGRFIIENNVFGTTKGHNDAIDFDGAFLPGPIPQIIGNTFMGGGDDALDLECDAWIEGNLFQHYRKDQYNTDTGNSNGISAGSAGHYIMVRNVFYDLEHGAQIKDGAFVTFLNNTVVNVANAAIAFDNPGETTGPGRGGYIDASIFKDTPTILTYASSTQELAIHRSIVTADLLALGTGNTTEDPRLVAPYDGNFALRPGSPAIGRGPNGIDAGASVPAGVSLLGAPPAQTGAVAASITVGGPGVVQYRYRLDGGAWSDPTLVATPIALSGLANGAHVLQVLAQNMAGGWQAESAATTRTWTVDPAYALRINEVLAVNSSAVNIGGRYPDLIELYNDGPVAIPLLGLGISDEPGTPKYLFKASDGSIAPGQRLILFADSRTVAGQIHLGFSLSGSGEGVYLTRAGAIVDAVRFGPQLADYSIGRLADGSWGLTVPTFGEANVPARTGDSSGLKINEWLADGSGIFPDDFVELYNPDPLPTPAGGMFLTDHPYIWPQKHQVAPLTFIPGSGFTAFIADADPENGPDHVDFKLSTGQEMIGLYTAEGELQDVVLHGPQSTGISQGRSPDGSFDYAFFTQPSPGLSNPAGAASALPLRIVEIAYNPPAGGAFSSGDYQFIELLNTGDNPIGLASMRLQGAVTFTFPDITLLPDQRIVVVADTAAFTSRYGEGVRIAGQFLGALSGNGDQLRLLESDGTIVQDFVYSDAWHPSTDGAGFTLVAVDPLAAGPAWSTPANWRASRFIFGSPGMDDPSFPLDQVVISEVLAHSHAGAPDWIELYNPAAGDIPIGNWYLSDSADNLRKFRIPAGTVLESLGYAVFHENTQFNNPDNPDSLIPFALSEMGDEVYLSSADIDGHLTGYNIVVSFGASATGVSFGRYQRSTGDFVFPPLAGTTPGGDNSLPKIGDVVITEVMYDPATGGEFIELRNVSYGPVDLFDYLHPENTWQFTDGISFAFPEGITLAPGEIVLVVPEGFVAPASVPAHVRLFGPYAGELRNEGERIALSRPGSPELTGEVPLYLVDSVEYSPLAPWPTAAAGGGASLVRIATGEYGDDVANWTAGPSGGTPGRAGAEYTLDGSAEGETFVVTLSAGIVTVTSQVLDGAPTVLLSEPADGIDALTIRGLGGDDRLVVSGALPFTPAFLGGDGENTLEFTAGASAMIAADAQSIDADRIIVSGAATTLDLHASQHLASLTILDSATVRLAGAGRVIRTGELQMSQEATLDLASNTLILSASAKGEDNLDMVESLIAQARNGGTWDHPGIRSASQAHYGLASLLNADGAGGPLLGELAGEQLLGDEVLVRHTLEGDLDLDDRVDGDDYYLLDRGLLAAGVLEGYRHGDINYDQVIDGEDYLLADGAFLTHAAAPAPAVAGKSLFATTPIADDPEVFA